MKPSRLKGITLDLLDFVLGLPEGFGGAFFRRSVYDAIRSCSDKKLTVENICKIYNELRRRGYIEIAFTEHGESVRFTDKAKLRALEPIAGRILADGKNRFVSFDIPEQMRRERNRFRRAIKSLGFRQVQGSLWVCNKDVGELVEMAASEYGVSEYFIYIVSEKSDVDKTINKMLSDSR